VGFAAVAATAAVAGYAAQRRVTNRWRATADELTEAGLVLSEELVHHDVPVGDGGSIHAVEAGSGPPIVLVHGVTLSVLTWARQFTGLEGTHRVIAIDQRGHGRSVAGTDGYRFDRMAEDVLDVLDALDVEQGVLVGHSMGGMVSLTAAIGQPGRLARRVAGLALVGTSAGPVTGVPLWPTLTDRAVSLSGRSLASAERRGRGLLPGNDVAAWGTRLAFGSKPTPLDLELTRTMVTAMSPTAMAELLGSLVGYDVRDGLGGITLPTTVVAGTRDFLLPPFHARRLANGIPGARLEMLERCGHMVMLERPEALNGILGRFSAEVRSGT
jgi:pimeloyl-ACP methyl ester carboxylesterase